MSKKKLKLPFYIWIFPCIASLLELSWLGFAYAHIRTKKIRYLVFMHILVLINFAYILFPEFSAFTFIAPYKRPYIFLITGGAGFLYLFFGAKKDLNEAASNDIGIRDFLWLISSFIFSVMYILGYFLPVEYSSVIYMYISYFLAIHILYHLTVIPKMFNAITGLFRIETSGNDENIDKSEYGKLSRRTSHTLLIKKDGTVYAYGKNNKGQLGNETFMDSLKHVKVHKISKTVMVAAGDEFSVALKKDGTVWTWGINEYGQLGNGRENDSPIPFQTEGLKNIKFISAGLRHAAALDKDGDVFTWGDNRYGQLGSNSKLSSDVPQKVNISDVTAVYCGSSHTAVLKKDGTVWAWGRNIYGQLADGTFLDRAIPVRCTIDSVKMLYTKYDHTVALRENGILWGWGDNRAGQLGFDEENKTEDASIRIGNGKSRPVKIPIEGVVVYFSTGREYTSIIYDDNKVKILGQRQQQKK